VKPSIGRIVHYVSYGTPGGEYASECRAAVITEVTFAYDPLPPIPDDQTVTMHFDSMPIEVVGLCVMNPTGLFLNREVRHDEDGKAGGTWHWPERVEES
jgi:hypothetical protein